MKQALFTLIFLLSSVAAAAPLKNATNEESQALKKLATSQLERRQATCNDSPVFLDIARNSDGSVKTMTNGEAIAYCLGRDAHLPSARELAQLSMSFGAKGIVDACKTSDKTCYKVESLNAKGTPDSFYFSCLGYRRPAYERGAEWLWSTSLTSKIPYYDIVFDSDQCFIGDDTYRPADLAVRCVATCHPPAPPRPKFLDIVRDSDGSVKTMTQGDAIQYCSKRGAHLPSARELAQLWEILGAKGIVDSCRSDDKCYTIEILNVDGTSDSFYFSYAGYQRPSGELGNNSFWSSSVYSDSLDYAFFLNGEVGNVGGSGVYFNAVRCVSGR